MALLWVPMKITKVSSIVLALMFFISGCSAFTANRDPNSLYVHLGAEPPHLNPMTATDASSRDVYGYIYETLLERNRDTLHMEPALAESWQIGNHGLLYRFKLKKGIFWSDGHEFTADDVVYSYKILMDPKTANGHAKVYYQDIEKVVKVDRYTVEFYYKKPYFLALEICGEMTIIPKHLFDNGENINLHSLNRKPVGTGPYKLESWDTGKRIILTRNETYRGKKPDIKRIVFSLVLEQSIALQMLKKGELDVVQIRAIQWERQTNSEKFLKRFYKLSYYQPVYTYIGWNGAKEPFNDPKVRRAMTHLVNRREILAKLAFGKGKIVTGNFYIFSKSYDSAIEPYKYNPARARELLASAGWKDTDNDGILDKNGKKFSFVYLTRAAGGGVGGVATILKEDFTKAGLDMKIRQYEWAVFLKKVHDKEYDAVSLAWSLGYSGDPYQLWHSSQIREGSNYVSFKNEEADNIIETARTELNEKKRTAMYRRFHGILHREQPYTFLFCPQELVVVSKHFDHVKTHVTGLYYPEWTVKKQ